MKLLIAIALFTLPWLSSDEVETPPPSEGLEETYAVSKVQRQIRAFRQLGDQFLAGDGKAYDARQKLTQSLGAELTKTERPAWSNCRELQALFQFVLFGGGSGPLRAALSHEEFPQEWRGLAEGLVAYSDRQLDLARERFADVDAGTLPATLKAPFMLVKGTLISSKEPADALKMFKLVRVMEPGTALEEAALRQEVLLLLSKDKLPDALKALAIYLRRFPLAVYWPQFVNVGARTTAQLAGDKSKDFIEVFDQIPNPNGANRYREFLLEVIRHQMTSGDFERAGKLAEEVVKKSDLNSQAWHRAKLYNLTSSVVGEEPEKVRERLMELDLDAYSSVERDLIQAALKIADQVRGGYKNRSDEDDGQAVQLDDKSYSRREARRREIDRQSIAVPAELKERVQKALEDAKSALSIPEL